VFEAMFLRSSMRESHHHTVAIPNLSPEVFRCVLEYLYTSQCSLTHETIFELYRAADQYVLQELKEACEEFINQELTVDTVAEILLEADEWHVSGVRGVCMALAAREFDDVSITQGFLQEIVPRHDLMMEILQTRAQE
jgi:kelch-like protein 24/35